MKFGPVDSELTAQAQEYSAFCFKAVQRLDNYDVLKSSFGKTSLYL